MTQSAVRGDLTRRAVENADYGQFVSRVIRAYGTRVATGDVEALQPLLSLRAELDEAVSVAVGGLRTAGYSWAEIASRLGIAKQTAWERWGQ